MIRHPHHLATHVNVLRRMAKQTGVRETARLARITPMSVSRFINRGGADDRETLYLIAEALGCRIELVTPSPGPRRPA